MENFIFCAVEVLIDRRLKAISTREKESIVRQGVKINLENLIITE